MQLPISTTYRPKPSLRREPSSDDGAGIRLTLYNEAGSADATTLTPTRHRARYPRLLDSGLAAFLEDRTMPPPQFRDHAALSTKTELEAEPPKGCLWCGRPFHARRDGGKRQVFCRPACRRDFDAAGRRWVAEAIAAGVMTVDALRNGLAATRALVPAAISPTSECKAPWQHPARISPPDFCYTRQRDLERLMAQAIAMRRR